MKRLLIFTAILLSGCQDSHVAPPQAAPLVNSIKSLNDDAQKAKTDSDRAAKAVGNGPGKSEISQLQSDLLKIEAEAENARKECLVYEAKVNAQTDALNKAYNQIADQKAKLDAIQTHLERCRLAVIAAYALALLIVFSTPAIKSLYAPLEIVPNFIFWLAGIPLVSGLVFLLGCFGIT